MPSFHFDHSWTKKELKDECRMRGISYYGLNKDDLVDELNSHVDHSWTKKKLQAECRIRGITYCGLNKDGLVHELNYSSRSGWWSGRRRDSYETEEEDDDEQAMSVDGHDEAEAEVDASWTKKELKAECGRRGLRSFGHLTKDDLLQLLTGTNTNANTAPPHRAGGAARASTTATNVVLLNKARNAATRRAIIWETRRCKILRNAGTERQRHQFESAHITMAARVRRRAAEADPRSTEARGLEARGGWNSFRRREVRVTPDAAQASGQRSASGGASSGRSGPANDAVDNRTLNPNNHICRVCMDTEVNCTLVPCGHLCCCFECAAKLDHCPVCRAKATQKIKTYRA